MNFFLIDHGGKGFFNAQPEHGSRCIAFWIKKIGG
jgi:hypothetical protein